MQAEVQAGGASGARFRLVTVLAGLHGAQAQVRWAREALALLEDGGAPAAGPAGTA